MTWAIRPVLVTIFSDVLFPYLFCHFAISKLNYSKYINSPIISFFYYLDLWMVQLTFNQFRVLYCRMHIKLAVDGLFLEWMSFVFKGCIFSQVPKNTNKRITLNTNITINDYTKRQNYSLMMIVFLSLSFTVSC